MGRSKLHKWLPALFFFLFFVEQSVQKWSMQQQIKPLLPPCLQKESWCTWGCLSTSRVLKECITTLMLWQNKEAHQGHCHTASAGCSSPPQLSGALVHREQLMEDCTTSPRELLPLCLNQENPHQTVYFSGVMWPGAKCHMSPIFIVIKVEGSRHGFLQVPDAQKALGNLRKWKWSQKGELSGVFCPQLTNSALLSLGQGGLGSASPQRQRFKHCEEGTDFFFHLNWNNTYLLRDICEGYSPRVAPSTPQIGWISVRLVAKQCQKQESGIKICSHRSMNLNNEEESLNLYNLLHLGLPDLTNQNMKHMKRNSYNGISFAQLQSWKKLHMEI